MGRHPRVMRNGHGRSLDQWMPQPLHDARPPSSAPSGFLFRVSARIGVRQRESPSRTVIMTASLVVTGFDIGGTAYAASPRANQTDTFYACTNGTTGAMRMIDPNRRANACNDRRGPQHETPIS